VWITVNAFGGVGDADMLEHLDGMDPRLLLVVSQMKLSHFHQLF
jgi:hypothetical protein